MQQRRDARVMSQRLLIAALALVAACKDGSKSSPPGAASAAGEGSAGARRAIQPGPQLPATTLPTNDPIVVQADARFEAEPRDEEFAKRLELRIRLHLAEGEVSCRKTQCRIILVADKPEHLAELMTDVQSQESVGGFANVLAAPPYERPDGKHEARLYVMSPM